MYFPPCMFCSASLIETLVDTTNWRKFSFLPTAEEVPESEESAVVVSLNLSTDRTALENCIGEKGKRKTTTYEALIMVAAAFFVVVMVVSVFWRERECVCACVCVYAHSSIQIHHQY